MNIDFQKIPSPCFVLAEELLLNNLSLLQSFQHKSGVHIICALKGFSFHPVFPVLKQFLHGATASSLHEAMLVHEKMGVKAHTYCPIYLPSEFEAIQDISSHITFNSLSQLELFRTKMRKDISYGLRVNPGYSEIKTDLYNPASPNSRLGIPLEQIGEKLPDAIEGIHFHAMCENNSYTLERLLDVFTEKYDKLIKQAKWVNMGGGHLITHKEYNIEHGISVLQKFRLNYPHLEEVILEPGSAIGWQTGYLISTVVDIVHNGEFPTAMLDVSFTCHMPDCLEMPYQPKVINEKENGKYEYNLGGMSCLAGDVMGTWRFENALQIGDKIAFDDMIHYTMVKTTTFNGINLPAIGIWKKHNTFELLQTFGYDDYKKRLG